MKDKIWGGARRGAGRKPRPPRIVGKNLVVSVQWMRANPKTAMEIIKTLTASL